MIRARGVLIALQRFPLSNPRTAHERTFLRRDGRPWVAGKTSLITELARRGFQTIPEFGRAIIREEMQSGGDALPWADRVAYAERMLERDLRAYSAAQSLSGPVIFDRGIPDITGYLTLCGLPVPPHVRRRSSQGSPLQRPRLSGAVLG